MHVGLLERRWDEISRALVALGMYTAAQAINEQLWPIPTKLGAVVRAARSGEVSEGVYVRAAVTTDEDMLMAWRSVESGDWVQSRHLHVREILAPGVDL